MLLMLRHTAEPASEASCCNLLIVFCSFSLDGQIFGDILSVFIPQSSELAYSGEMENTWIAGWGREKELHLVSNVWLSGLGWAWRSIGCDWYNLSHLKSSCGDCCHVPTLHWNNVPRGPALHPNAFVTLGACMRHPGLDTCTVPCGLLSHIDMLRSLSQTEPQIEKTAK